MSSGPDNLLEKEGSLTKEPENSNEPKTAEDSIKLEVAKEGIGGGDAVSSLNISETSPNNDIQHAKDDDVELILDSGDDDEDLHLKWDDDEEIEDDIISLNIPTSPLKEEPQSETGVLPDKEPVIDKDLAGDKVVVGTEDDEEIILMDDENDKAADTSPNSAEQTLQSVLQEIDDICAEIDDHPITMDRQAKNKNTDKNVIKPCITEDLILIEDDDDEDNNDITVDNVSTVKTENLLDDSINEISSEQIDIENEEKVGDTTELDIETNEDVMEIDLLDDEYEKSNDIKSAVIEDNIDKIVAAESEVTATQKSLDEIEKHENDDLAAIKDNDVINAETIVTETQSGFGESEKPKEVEISVIEDKKDTLTHVSDVEMVEVEDTVNTQVDEVVKNNIVTSSPNAQVDSNVIKNDNVTSSPNESLLDSSSIPENLEHGLNKPNMMLEIPTQEVIEFLDDTDVSIDLNKSIESDEKICVDELNTSNNNISVNNEMNVEATADNESSDNKKLEENSEVDTVQTPTGSDQNKDAIGNIQETLASETELESISSKHENLISTIEAEKELITKVKQTDNISIPDSDIALPKPVFDITTDCQDKDLRTSSEMIQQKLSNTDTLIEKDSNTETDMVAQDLNTESVVQETSSDNTETKTLDLPITKLDEELLKINSEEEVPSNTEEIKSASSIESQPSTSNTIEPEISTPMEVEPLPTTSQDIETPSEIKSENLDIPKTNPVELEAQVLTSNVDEAEISTPMEVEPLPTTSQDIENPSEINSKDLDMPKTENSSEIKSKDLDIPKSTPVDLEAQVSTSNVDESEISTPIEVEPLLTTSQDIENPTEIISKDLEVDKSDPVESEAQVSTSNVTEEGKLPTTSQDIETSTEIKSKDLEGEKSNPLQSEAQVLTSNVDEGDISTKMEVELLREDIEKPTEIKSKDVEVEKSNPVESDAQVLTSNVTEAKSNEMSQVDDELQEVSDSLGLLAESSRVMEDDEEPEDEDDDDDDDDQENDQDQDESSNQMTAEHSEDSNAQQSETDIPKEPDDKTPEAKEDNEEFNFGNIVSVTGTEEGKEEVAEKDGDIQEKDGEVEVDEFCDEVEVTPEQIGDVETVEEPTVTEDVVTEEAVVSEESAEPQEKPTEPNQAVEVETVKLSDTSDSDADAASMLRNILLEKQKEPSPAKSRKTSLNNLTIGEAKSAAFNYVDLEESSSEDDNAVDVQEVNKTKSAALEVEVPGLGEEVIFEVIKPTAKIKTPRINTSEISIKTISSAEAAALPQIQLPEDKPAPKFGLEVFSLDSDEEDAAKPAEPEEPIQPKEEPPKEPPKVKKHRCINLLCKSAGSRRFVKADAATLAYYDAARKKRTMVCEECADAVVRRTQSLVDGIKEFTPLLLLDIAKVSSELVEISDSESEEEEVAEEPKVKEKIGEEGVKLLEEHLADMINQTWKKFKLDARLTEAQDMLNEELKMLEEQSKEIDTMLSDCQVATDKLRKELYATFEHDRQELTPLIIYDTPNYKLLGSFLETETPKEAETTPSAKRRMSSGTETPAKRPHTDAIPLGYSPIDNTSKDKDTSNIQDKSAASDSSKLDDDKDISVLQVSAEVAPPSLPPPGPLTRPPLKVGACVYAMRNIFGSWLKGRILEVQGKTTVPGSTHMFTICRVKFEHKARHITKLLPGRCLAYSDATDVRMTIGTRVIALFKDTTEVKRESFYSGIVAEVPNPVNKYRYLVFFDDGYAQYVRHEDTRLVCECAPLVWEEVHPYSREFVKEYLMAYPERPMVRLHAGQSLKTEWNGKWWSSRVIKVDASLVHVHFEEDNRTEWIYRGSTRLAPLYLELLAAERHGKRPRPIGLPRTKAQPRTNMPYVEYTRSDEQNKSEETSPPPPTPAEGQRETRQRSVAKKSTAPAPAPAPTPVPHPPHTQVAENVTSRVVYYTPKNAVKPHKMVPHTCGPQCKRSDVLALRDLRTYNPLAKPLLSGWERQIVRLKGHKEVMYRAPCGRRLRNMRELHRYLRVTHSDMAVDLFDFAPNTHCLAEFVLNSCLVGKKDLSHGKENVPVPCVNYYDDSLPEFCSYNTERTPTAGVPLNLDPEFLCGCDCTDDCEDKSKCACWRMTMEGARTIGMDSSNVGYVYRRLPEPLPTGIYECNSRCKCKQTCLNRVAQHPLQLKLQVFKTLNRGWGIRALNDVPKGSFLCVYAGNLLTDATANMDGLNEGDEYLAELDYIEVVEQMKEGYEEDIPDADKRLDRKNQAQPSDDESEELSSSEEEDTTKADQDDYDFKPAAGESVAVAQFSKRLRKREKKKQEEDAKEKEKQKEAQQKNEDDCITISDDEEVREPSRFTATAGMASNEFKSKYRSVRTLFGKDEACYIMDAKVQGNIGRYLNHSCTPNVFVQNVFVDTHDPRFPWVAFFALCHIKAGTELTWNYNYDVGSVPGKVLYCYCGAPNCRGRLL